MRACESDAHDAPGRLGSEARNEGCSAIFAGFCAGFACNRVGGGVLQFLTGRCCRSIFSYLSLPLCLTPLLPESPWPVSRRGRTGVPPIFRRKWRWARVRCCRTRCIHRGVEKVLESGRTFSSAARLRGSLSPARPGRRGPHRWKSTRLVYAFRMSALALENNLVTKGFGYRISCFFVQRSIPTRLRHVRS